MVEKSFQRQADKLFMKHQVHTRDGDNTWQNILNQ
jgi:hypothetical protein